MTLFTTPTRIHLAPHSLEGLAHEVRQLGTRALIVTDPHISKLGLLEPIESSLRSGQFPFDVFDQVEGNPDVTGVDEAHEALQRASADVLIAVGGGSAIDTAKAVAVLATGGGQIEDYEGVDRVEAQPVPLVAVPTTVGSGSEVTKGAVITNPQTKVKMVIVSDRLYPATAFLDQRMVQTLPASMVAGTGGDALAHAIEGYVAKGANHFTDALNLHAIELIGRSLRPATAGVPDAQFEMLVAACIAGAGFHNAGLGLVHALANTAGGHFGIHHGTANTILLPPVMSFNLIACPDRFAEIARRLGAATDDLAEMDAARAAVDAVEKLFTDVNAPRRLRDVGVDEEAIPAMAKDAMDAADRPGNPRSNTQADLERVYHQAY